MSRAVGAVLLIAMVAGACVRIPPKRVLPESITSLYIVTFENRSYEPGLEEKLTRFTQEEFLVDGRLDVTRRPSADAVLVGKLQRFNVMSDRFGSDEFPLTSRIMASADVALYDPSDRKREKPLMEWEAIGVEFMHVSDVRRVMHIIADDANEAALRELAHEIVMTVLTREPDKVASTLMTAPPPASTSPQRVPGRKQLDTRFLDAASTESLPARDSSGRPQEP